MVEKPIPKIASTNIIIPQPLKNQNNSPNLTGGGFAISNSSSFMIHNNPNPNNNSNIHNGLNLGNTNNNNNNINTSNNNNISINSSAAAALSLISGLGGINAENLVSSLSNSLMLGNN